MLTRYRKSLRKHLVSLRRFEENPGDLACLGEIQSDLYRTICRVERAKKTIKESLVDLKVMKRRGRLEKVESASVKKRIKALESKLTEYDKTLYLLRAIGDGIAFSIFDKWDLKPLHFKEDSGHIYGKSGGRKERWILNAILKRGVPAVHCDITNVLRYGDVCVKVGEFPSLIEVKSSKNTNERVERQIDSIRKIHKYYETDEIDGLYGVPKTTRVAPSTKEVEYSSQLNELISRSKGEKCSWAVVEPGLVYAIVREFDEPTFEDMIKGMVRPIIGLLNDEKYSGVWSSYRPYTLAIRDVDSLLEFVYGEFTIIVIYDDALVAEHARCRGYDVALAGERDEPIPEFMDRAKWLYKFTKADADLSDEPAATFYASFHFIGRSQFEFVSVKWLVDVSIDNITNSMERNSEWTECALTSDGG